MYKGLHLWTKGTPVLHLNARANANSVVSGGTYITVSMGGMLLMELTTIGLIISVDEKVLCTFYCCLTSAVIQGFQQPPETAFVYYNVRVHVFL